MTSSITTLPDFATQPGTRRPLHILYADDMQQLRELFTIVLTREGYTIETVPDGQDALERLQREPATFDLLITDHHMPRLNGLDLVRQARQLPFTGKIIVFSSELSQTMTAQYRDNGVDLILPKPIFPHTLRVILVQLFTAGGMVAADTPSGPPRLRPDGGSCWAV